MLLARAVLWTGAVLLASVVLLSLRAGDAGAGCWLAVATALRRGAGLTKPTLLRTAVLRVALLRVALLWVALLPTKRPLASLWSPRTGRRLALGLARC